MKSKAKKMTSGKTVKRTRGYRLKPATHRLISNWSYAKLNLGKLIAQLKFLGMIHSIKIILNLYIVLMFFLILKSSSWQKAIKTKKIWFICAVSLLEEQPSILNSDFKILKNSSIIWRFLYSSLTSIEVKLRSLEAQKFLLSFTINALIPSVNLPILLPNPQAKMALDS